ncbi:MAG: hypothetical protein LKJ50_00240 [Clostridiales bacterium]|nr:hypothetical protein [Clostridiales bacterium]MCI1960336.1 hypothetical protein [Clostridiales bacterium]MCI2020823.1 hypothetical protein [Clostridiales bacterium]MCI2025206.1 hypothetical protein [Clostridiales bacterium]
MTGRSLGPCAGTGSLAKGAGLGLGLGMACRRGFGKAFANFLPEMNYRRRIAKDCFSCRRTR